jgi:hypothetical protein
MLFLLTNSSEQVIHSPVHENELTWFVYWTAECGWRYVFDCCAPEEYDHIRMKKIRL